MKSFEELYRECFRDVYRYLLKLCADEALAEELTSDTFFKAMKSLDSFRGDCDERLWLLRIARNCFYDHRKKAAPLKSLDEPGAEELISRSPGPEEQTLNRSEAEKAIKLLGALPEVQREVFMWRFQGGLSFRSIGAMFGKSENWACVTCHRARSAIKKGLEDYNNG